MMIDHMNKSSFYANYLHPPHTHIQALPSVKITDDIHCAIPVILEVGFPYF